MQIANNFPTHIFAVGGEINIKRRIVIIIHHKQQLQEALRYLSRKIYVEMLKFKYLGWRVFFRSRDSREDTPLMVLVL